jgi:hypothetical protein
MDPSFQVFLPKFWMRHSLPMLNFTICYFIFYGEKVFSLCPFTDLEENTLEAIRDCLFEMLAATVYIINK